MFFFISLSFSLTARKHLAEKTTHAVLPEFGFSRGGEFKGSIFGLNLSGSILILATQSQYAQIHSNLKNAANLCIFPEQALFYEYNFTASNHSHSDIFSFKIKERNIYYPIIFNCNGKSLSITATYLNPNSYLDFRDRFIPKSSCYFSIIYSIFAMFWIINMFTHPSFDLLLPKLFCLSCCLKALSSAFTANYWIELSDAGIASIRTVLISELANILSNTFLFTINLLAAYGLSSFRTSVSYGEVIWAISAPMWLFIARRFIFHTEDLLLSVIYGLIVISSLFSFIGKLSNASLFTMNLYEWSVNNHVKLKSKLPALFSGLLIIISIFFIFCVCYNACMFNANSLLFMSEELMIMIFTAADIDSFYLRKSFEPPDDSEDTVENIDPEGIHMLDEPQESQLAFLTLRQN